MNDAPKTAYEIAMEKIRKRDRELGEEGPGPLTGDQKQKIAAIRRKFAARLAEAEILYEANRAKAGGDPEALQRLEEQYGLERRRIEERREREIEKARAARSGRQRQGE